MGRRFDGAVGVQQNKHAYDDLHDIVLVHRHARALCHHVIQHHCEGEALLHLLTLPSNHLFS